MRRWRVASDRDVGAARGARAFGGYTFNVSDGSETFPLWYGMTEGYPWSQPVDGARYDALHAGARLRPRDVTVASYPKTGTTWVEQIVLLLLHGSGVAPKLDPASRNSYVPGRRDVGCVWLEPTVASRRGGRFTLDQFDAIPAPRVIKSHAPFDSLVGTRSVPGKRGVDALKASGSRVVYVSRNPKDAAVSLYFQRAPVPGPARGRRPPPADAARPRGLARPPAARRRPLAAADAARAPAARRRPPAAGAAGRPRGRRDAGRRPGEERGRRRRLAAARPTRRMPMDAWCALYTKGYMASGSYFEHVARWHAASRAPGSPVLFLKYEALRADPRKQIRRIAAHLGLERDAAEIDRVADLSSFERMKASAAAADAGARSDARNPKYAVAPGGNSSNPAHTTGHIREGGSGGWVQHFSKLLSDQFDAEYRRQLDGYAAKAAADFGVDVEAPTFDFGGGCVA